MKRTKLLGAAITTLAVGWAIAAIAQKPDKSAEPAGQPSSTPTFSGPRSKTTPAATTENSTTAPSSEPPATFSAIPDTTQSAADAPAAGAPSIVGISVKVFPLKHARAAELALQIHKMYVEDVVPDDRTNMVIVRGSEYTLGEVAEFVKLLDVPGSASATSNVPYVAPMSPGGIGPRMRMPGGGMMGMMRGSPSATPPTSDYLEAEKRAVSTSIHYRKLADTAATTANDQEKLAKLKSALHKEVEAAFNERQKSQTAELEQLRTRLSQIEAAISNREKNREAIINRRVEELINPDVQWDAGVAAQSLAPTQPKSSPGGFGGGVF